MKYLTELDSGGFAISIMLKPDTVPSVRHIAHPDITEGEEVISVDFDTGFVVTGIPPVTADEVIAERIRRLEQGFDYTFADSRGTHHFATTEEDMKGWSAVDASAGAFIDVGLPDQEIQLITGTGVVAVTAIEWKSVMVAAAIWQQPIWQSSFVLQSIDPIPSNYKDDEHWP